MDNGTVDRNQIKSNGWRLGRCFDESSSPELYKLIQENHKSDGVVFIAVTHDCSLIHPKLEKEPYLEYVTAIPIDKHCALNTEAKDIRCLHLPLSVDGDFNYFEIQMANRGFVDRSPIERNTPSKLISLPTDSRAILVRWLSNRYTTQTLPDAFDQRIRPLVKSSKSPLRKLFEKPEATDMLGIYIDLEPPHTELENGKNYQLTVLLLYKDEATHGGYDLDRYEENIELCFAKAKGVEVKGVMALSDKDISVHRIRRMRRWQLDFISFRDQTDDVALIEDDLS